MIGTLDIDVIEFSLIAF